MYLLYVGDIVCNEVGPPLVSQTRRDLKVVIMVTGHYINIVIGAIW